MRITDMIGEHTENSIKEIEKILLRRYDPSVNAFSLSHDGADYPILSILVNDDVAALDFLQSEDHPGFKSIGNLPGIDPNQSTLFCISRNHADDVEVQNDALIPFSLALDAAREFVVSGRKPECVGWLEL